MNYRQIINQIISETNDINFIFVKSGDMYCQANGENQYINNCFQIGQQIYIGIYENQQLMLISILHQIGHIIQPYTQFISKFQQEVEAWKYAMILLKQYNIQLTSTMKKYMKNCIESYHKEQYNG